MGRSEGPGRPGAAPGGPPAGIGPPGAHRTLLVGHSPARPDLVGRVAFVDTRSGATLASLMGLDSADELPRHFDLVNLVHRWFESSWPEREARDRATGMWNNLILPVEYDEVVVFGTGPARAFSSLLLEWDFPDFDGRTVTYLSGKECTWYSCPHPSGLVRWWNNPENRKAGASFLRDVFDRAKRG